jgi:hypothetical protein
VSDLGRSPASYRGLVAHWRQHATSTPNRDLQNQPVPPGHQSCPVRQTAMPAVTYRDRSQNSRQSPCSWQATARAPGANGLQPAGPLLSPINRTGRCDVPQDPLAPGFWSSGPAPSRYSHRGPGGQLRNVSTAGVSQRSQARRLGTADSGVKEAPAGLGRYDGIQPPFPRHALQLHKATIVEDDSGPGNQVFHRL